MKKVISLRTLSVFAVGIASLATTSYASTTTLDAVGSGWYNYWGQSSQNSGAGGNTAASGPLTSVPSKGDVYRDWIGFDLSSISQPILSATLIVESDSRNNSGQIFKWWDVSTTYSQLGAVKSLGIYNDLGTGTLFGQGTHTAGTLNSFALNSDALASLNSNHSLWAIGGENTQGGAGLNYAFAFRHGIVDEKMELVLTLQDPPPHNFRFFAPVNAPETGSTLAMMGAGLLGLAGLRKRLAA